jgi:hypothetical protein
MYFVRCRSIFQISLVKFLITNLFKIKFWHIINACSHNIFIIIIAFYLYFSYKLQEQMMI